jgi:hypothetical protein
MFQIRVQPIRLADEDRRTDNLLPEHDRYAAYENGKDDDSRGEFVIGRAFLSCRRARPRPSR